MNTGAKQRGTKSEKQRTQADREKHAEICRKYRQKNKEQREELQQQNLMLKAENQTMIMEFEYYKSMKELELQQYKRVIQNQKGDEELIKQLFFDSMAYHGYKFSSFNQAVEWFLSQNYAEGGQVLRASGTGLQSVNVNFQPSMADFDQQMCFDQDNTNIAAFTAVGPAYTANHAGSSASHNLPEYGALDNHNNLCNRDLVAGVPTVSGANPTLVFGSTNNNEKDGDLFSFVKFHYPIYLGDGLHKTPS